MKTLSAESKQGVREFLTEINTLANVRHPNLVELIGCCVEGNKRILVYEYVENSSLDRVLLGKRIRSICMKGCYTNAKTGSIISFACAYRFKENEYRYKTGLGKKICYLYRYC